MTPEARLLSLHLRLTQEWDLPQRLDLTALGEYESLCKSLWRKHVNVARIISPRTWKMDRQIEQERDFRTGPKWREKKNGR